MRLAPLGDSGLMVEFGRGAEAGRRAQALAVSLAGHPLPGVRDVVPAFGTVTVYFDRLGPDECDRLAASLMARAESAGKNAGGQARELIIPIHYGPAFAPDLGRVAARAGLSPEAVVARHAGATYRVAAVGFTPGFAYLEGLPEALRTPRLETPRLAVPAGSVGLGGEWTGIYPHASPGGWNLIGRTPLRLFDPQADPPARLQVGDRVRFKAIAEEEFLSWP